MAKKTETAKSEAAAPAVHTPSKAKFVTVASKLPMSIELQLCRMKVNKITGQYGTAEETVAEKTGPIVVIRGNSMPQGTLPKGFPRQQGFIEDATGGYCLTPNVPAEFWDKWLEQNKDTQLVTSGMLKAQPDMDSLAADAAEHAKVDSGLGPLDPDGDRRNPKPPSMSISGVSMEVRGAVAA